MKKQGRKVLTGSKNSQNSKFTWMFEATACGKAWDAQTDTLHNTSCELRIRNFLISRVNKFVYRQLI